MGQGFENMTLKELGGGLSQGDFTSKEVTERYLKTIEVKNKGVYAYLEVFSDVLTKANEADIRIAKKEKGKLLGIPLAIKDNILIQGKISSAASKMLENYTATYSATVIEKLLQEGAILIGRTNMDEFAMGSSTENSAFGVTRNPYDESRVPGGSSGGSAASVSMHGAPAALGSDTGGSIRQPAAFCGLVGLKPTYGSVSRFGLIAMGSSFDQVGPLTQTVGDTELLFNILKGHDPKDSTSISQHTQAAPVGKQNMTIGVPRDFLTKGIDDDVLELFEKKLSQLEKEGHTVYEISLPHIQYALASYYILMFAESSTNLSRFDGVRYGLHVDGENLIDEYAKSRGAGFGSEVRRRILLGTYVLSAGYYDAYYSKAWEARRIIGGDFEKAFQSVDVIVTPTTPTPAFKLGEKSSPLAMYLEDIFTTPANITGLPALSVPMGFVNREGKELPVGFQCIGPHLGEDVLFALGKNIESLS